MNRASAASTDGNRSWVFLQCISLTLKGIRMNRNGVDPGTEVSPSIATMGDKSS